MRSLLFAPATRPDLVEKLPRSQPDAAVIDLEDAVPEDFKETARISAVEQTERLAARHPRLEIYVRVNGVATPWFHDDMAFAVSPLLAGVVVPKVEEPADLEAVRHDLEQGDRAGLRIVAGIESARGVAQVERLLSPEVYAAYFGAEDYIADIGGRRTLMGDEVIYARSRFVLAARVAGVVPVDQAVVDVRNDDVFRADAVRGRALGFRGKICVHPRQAQMANEVFGASEEERDRARRLLEAWAQAADRGVGATTFEGAMIDEPALRMARETLRLGDAADLTGRD
jgi:citrate lyase subunit beta/citryl-CoA lyase